MKCINCGSELSETDFCTVCGIDVSLYKKIIRVSNSYYNDGLEKARVRDLSGAVVSLKRSVGIYKNNTNARNLLGLLYFEMGQVVDALSEWIISKNLQNDQNIAGDYIKAIQSNQTRLETINQTIKKYNQALTYCSQGSEDLAIIQLKKVLSLNPNLIQAQQLLAILYMKTKDYEQSSKALNQAQKMDCGNTMTMRYIMELSDISGGSMTQDTSKKGKEKTAVLSKAGNDTVIQPVRYKESPSGWATVINVLVGLVLGAALIWFCFVPAYLKSEKSKINQSAVESSDQISAKNANISQLEKEVETAKAEMESSKAELIKYTGEGGLVSSYENLLAAVQYQKEENLTEAAKSLALVSGEVLPETVKPLYESLNKSINAKAAGKLYTSGYGAYQKNDMEKAIADLSQVVQMDSENNNAVYYLARAYQKQDDNENAKKYFKMVVDKFPGTKNAKNAAERLKALQ